MDLEPLEKLFVRIIKQKIEDKTITKESIHNLADHLGIEVEIADLIMNRVKGVKIGKR